jgi:hypothetical protein
VVAGDFVARVRERPMSPQPSCVAEELALLAIADQAAVIGTYELLLSVEAFDAEEYLESTMQDVDVRLLWDRVGRRAIAHDALDFVNLDFASWFVPFRTAMYPVAPEPSSATIAHWIEVNGYGPESSET